MEVLKVEGKRIYVRFSEGKEVMEIWIPKDMLRQYGVRARDIKVGQVYK